MILTQSQAAERLSPKLAYDAVERALIAAADGSGIVNETVIGNGFRKNETFSIKSGSSERGGIVGVKIGSYWPGNSDIGIARHGSTVIMLDPDTGRVMAMVDASELNGARTAAADAVAASVLARADCEVLLLIGAGRQARYEAHALCSVRGIRRILVVSRTTEKAATLCECLQHELDIDAHTISVEAGCRQADMIVTVTPSRAPLFEAAWVRPGTHLACMGSDQRGKQELPLELVRLARLFCDLPTQSVMIGEFQHVAGEVRAGLLELTAIGDVLTGRSPGRRDDQEITVFDSSGLALQDLYVAAGVLGIGA